MSIPRHVRSALTDPARFTARLREEAEASRVGSLARQSTRSALRAVVGRSGLTSLAVRGPVGVASHFSVLDGHTLNLYAGLPCRAERAELLFTHRGIHLRVPAELVRKGPVPGDVRATVLLGEALGGVPLTEGSWQLSVELISGRFRRPPVPLRSGSPVVATGPTVAAPPSPLTGLTITPETTPSGLCRLAVVATRPRAELTGVRIGATEIEIRGRFAGIGPVAGATVRFTPQGRTSGHGVAAVVEGERFVARVPLEAMAPECAAAERRWDVAAEIAGHRPLRIGRYLHDVGDPRRMLRLPQRVVVPSAGALVRVRPYYTGTGHLVLACASLDTFSGADQ